MTIVTYEKGKRAGACREIAASSPLLEGYKMLTILPIPTTRDGVRLTGCEVTLDSLASEAEEGEIYLGYQIPPWLADALIGAGARVVDAALDEGFLVENANLTAIATLGLMLREFERAPSEISVGIVGYGRIGRALLRLLLPLGYDVTVFSTRGAVVDCLGASGVSSRLVRSGDPLPVCDLLVNTAPAPLFDCSLASPDMPIFELAGSGNFPVADGGTRLDLRLLPSLPNRHLPVSAGRAYAAALLRALGGEG